MVRGTVLVRSTQVCVVRVPVVPVVHVPVVHVIKLSLGTFVYYV